MSESAELNQSFEDLRDALQDIETAGRLNADLPMDRLVLVLDTEPLAEYLVDALPSDTNLNAWLAVNEPDLGSLGGTQLKWPTPRDKRVALPVEICRAAARGEIVPLDFASAYFPPDSSEISAYHDAFIESVIVPMVRDLPKLGRARRLPHHVSASMSSLPATGDSDLERLIAVAIDKFKDPAPSARQDAIEGLWDAWERLKTIDHANKRLSTEALLDRAASEPKMREVLEQEAAALTKIGNDFHIRHFERNRTAIEGALQRDYLFQRLFALMHLLLHSRA